MIKLFRTAFFILLLEGVVSAQNWEAVLVSGDTARGLDFTEIQGEVLLATQLGRRASDIQTFEIEKINELRFVKKRKVHAPWKTRLAGMTGGSVIGYGAGHMMGNIILWWLSYEELGSLKLFSPRPEDMNSGEELIVDIAIRMVTVMGLLKGYDWKMEMIDDATTYRLTNLTINERKTAVKEAIWPKRPSWIREAVRKSMEIVKERQQRQ